VSDLPLQFPVLALIRVPELRNFVPHDTVHRYRDEEAFTNLDGESVKDGEYADMRVVDVSGKCWRVTSITFLDADKISLRKFLKIVLGGQRRVRYELKEEPMSFEAIRHFVCTALENFPYGFRHIYMGLAGDDGEAPADYDPPWDDPEVRDKHTARFMTPTNIRELFAAVDTFMNELH
jgi:hypothetical protein